MTSSQIAQAVLLAVWTVATLILTSAQLRVMQRAPPRRGAYVAAWVICSLLLGALLAMTDRGVGVCGPSRLATNFALCAVVSGLALAAGAWGTRRLAWAGPARFLTLLALHALVVFVAAYPFI
ncbi:MAG: hypothetical protein WD825_04375 [Gemmatimonadaceae bacterium]